MNQDLAQVRVAALADSYSLPCHRSNALRSSPIQAANSRPLRKAAPLPMEATIAFNQRSDARDLPQSPTRSIARSDPFHFVVHLHDLKLQVLPLAPQHGNQVRILG